MSNKENTESRLKQDNRTIYDYMKLVFGCFIIGLVIVALSFVALVYRVPADKLIIDFSLGDGVISIIATLIGVMVTFAIGYQILNAIQIKESIEKYQHETKTQIQTQNDVISQFKTELMNIALVKRVYVLQKAIKDSIIKLDNLKPQLESSTNTIYYTQYLQTYYEYFEALHEYSQIIDKVDEIYLYKDFAYNQIRDILQYSGLILSECKSGYPDIDKDRNSIFISLSCGKVNTNESIKSYCAEIKNEVLKFFPNKIYL